MSKIHKFIVFVCLLTAANAWAVPFKDDFDRPNGPVGNGWSISTDGTITAEIVDNEAVISGTQATDWVRCGISRPVSNETRISFDFMATSFNFHVRIDSAGNSAYLEVYCWPGGPMSHANSLDGGWPGWTEIGGSNSLGGQYNTFVLEQEGTKFTITLNGEVVGTVTNANFTSIESVFISSDAAAGATGSLHIDNVQIGVVIPGKAEEPSPASDADDVPRDVVLGWKAGEYAATHTVYFGDNADDVNNATVANPLTATVQQGLTDATFAVPGPLEFGKTYYWRIDEVNAPPSNKVFKGDVWSFATEPYMYTVTGVRATASSSARDTMGPEQTVNGSGLTDGVHSTVDTAMWLSIGGAGATLPAWIRYELPQPCKLQEMRVWNSNSNMESAIGYGAKDVTIEYSLDGIEYTLLREQQFERAPADGLCEAQVVPMDGVYAKFVRLTISSNWGGYLPQAGLSEVQFSHIPVTAWAPTPGMYEVDVPLDAAFDWRDGREVVTHDVYLSTDAAAVAAGTAPVATVTQSRYQASGLGLGQVYYWKVNEVNEAASPNVWEGEVWSFSTTEFRPIDDFEDYTEDYENLGCVYQTWIDGLGFTQPTDVAGNDTGAEVGHPTWDPASPYYGLTTVETDDTIAGSTQAMPLYYYNDDPARKYYSEATRTWTQPQDLSAFGATDLRLWFRGRPAGFVETPSGNMIVSASGSDIYQMTDEFRFVYKRLTGDGSITARVESIQNTSVWAKGGVMIREGLATAAPQVDVIATPNNLVEFMYRTAAGVSTNAVATEAGTNPLPHWVRLTRKGNTFTGEYSADGVAWTQVTGASVQDVSMLGEVYIGLCVTAQNANAVTLAEFSNITVTGATGNWETAEIGVDHPSNDPEPLYVVVEDSTGGKKVVYHEDPQATCVSDWTAWEIPLSEFSNAGVKLTAVRKITIGVGNRENPTAGGPGVLFIDDIEVGRPIPPIGLVAHYALEDNTDDGSGNGRHGTAVGNPAYVDGPAGFGKALQFDGLPGSQYVNLGTMNPSAFSGQLSLAMWARWDGPTTQWQGLIGKRDAWTAQDTMWCIEIERDTQDLRFFQYDSWPDHGLIVLPVGEWQHVAVTFNGTTAAMYINGEPVGGDQPFTFGPKNDAAVVFGCCEANGGNPFNGALDEVYIYDTVLTEAEVRALAGK